MKPTLNPLSLKVLGQKPFGMGPKKAAGDITEFVRGVIDTMNLVQEATRISYRPQTINEDILLASEGGYNADRERALFDAMLLVDAAIWRFDFLRPTADDLGLTDSHAFVKDFNRTLEEALVLNSTVVNKHSFLVTLSHALSLTDHARQNLLIEAILDILLLEHNGEYQKHFLRSVTDNLTITSQGSTAVNFAKALTDVITFSQSGTVTGDFIRAVTDLLLIVDDPQYLYIVLRAVADLMTISDDVLQTMAFGRSDTRTLNISDAVAYSLVTGVDCSTINWMLVGSSYWSNIAGCIAANSGRTGNTETRYNLGGTAAGTAVGKWRGGVLAPNGYIYCSPFNDNYVLKIDPTSNTQSTIGSSLSAYGSVKWSGICMSMDGNYAICSMWGATSMLTINTANDTPVVVGSGFTGGAKWSGIVTNKDGYSYMMPFDATYMLGVDNSNTSNTFNAITGLTGADKWAGCQLCPDGVTILAIPSSSTELCTFNTANTTNVTQNTINSSITGTLKYNGSCLTDEGYVYSVPYSNTNAIKVNTANWDHSFFGSFTGTTLYSDAVFAFNRRVYGVPFDSSITSVLRIDTQNSDYMDAGAGVTTDVNKFLSGVYYPDGTIILVPSRVTRATGLYIDTSNTTPTVNILRCPYFNQAF